MSAVDRIMRHRSLYDTGARIINLKVFTIFMPIQFNVVRRDVTTYVSIT